ncbi:ferrous iron transport protein B [Methanocalculus alkaliphilus]|uniref:ferrous iron transport protein B n=1 Tax=Methanocalculus alkaliphilus TaxID=768730 RepID=UPI0020A09120|nr:ferrous iron transport protein B [Methanocalculus alkaliphilus]MCP1715450.1 ferrous iron transport protein B [Methanocalculus alkaliphilus]
MKKAITVALTGNPNVGKTTLFNTLTGSRQHVGNWPGVTVEKKEGTCEHAGRTIEVTDLPGTYSLTAYSADEVVARNFIIEDRPDVVVQVVDASNLERNLYLTMQLAELGRPVIIALNMVDVAEGRGDTIDERRLAELLAMPVIRTVGTSGKGLEDLLDAVVAIAAKGEKHTHTIGYGDNAEALISDLVGILDDDPDLAPRYPLRWLAVRLIEGDADIRRVVSGSSVGDAVFARLADIDFDEYEATLADKRYEAIGAILPQACTICVRKMTGSDMIDRVVTNKYLGIPIFLALMWGAFQLTFAVAEPFMEGIEHIFGWLGEGVAASVGTEWLASLLGDGVIGGVGGVLVFVPNIFILFLILSILEGSGYLARGAFIMDRLMYAIGLPGKSFIPMLMGFGCNVPAIMSTRTIEDERDRLITILVNPFISCGARLPVYILFAGVFFGRDAGNVIFGLYVLGILVAILSAKLFRSTVLPGESSPFIMEMPPYRIPTLKNALLNMWEKGSTYLKKAGGIILIGSLIVWFLASFPAGVEYGSEESFAGMIGKTVEPLVAPLGLDWKIAVALIFGFVAKEIVVSSLGVLYGAEEGSAALSDALLADPALSTAGALAVMVFVLLYMPCVATLAIIRKETGSWRWATFSVIYGLVVAWVLAFVTFHLAGFFLGGA